MEDNYSNGTWDGSQSGSDHDSNQPFYRHIYYLVLLSKSRNHVLVETLENNRRRLPALELSTSISSADACDFLEEAVVRELDISVRVVCEIPNGNNREIHIPHGIEINTLFLADILHDRLVVSRRLNLLHRS